MRANNYFDGPFDQLPDNFIAGEALRDAILSVRPHSRAISTASVVRPTAAFVS